jgi:phosphate transport system protein
MTEHIVTSFDDDLAELDGLIRWMGETASVMVARATRAIIEADEALAQQVIAEDGALDRRQRELDDKAITLIARRQPMAADLRVVVGAIRMAADLERIGDLAKNISKRVGAVGEAAAPRY